MLQNPLTNALLLSLYWKNRTAWIRKMSSWQSKITSSMLLPLRRKRVSNFLLLYISAWLHPFFFLKKSVAFRCINHWPRLEKENLLGLPRKGACGADLLYKAGFCKIAGTAWVSVFPLQSWNREKLASSWRYWSVILLQWILTFLITYICRSNSFRKSCIQHKTGF